MSQFEPLAFTRCAGVVLYEEECDNMSSDWVDVIVATRTQRGKFTVYLRKWAEDRNGTGYMHKWQEIRKVKGISNPADFLSTLKSAEEELGSELDWLDVLDRLKPLDAQFAQAVADYRKIIHQAEQKLEP